MRIVQISSAQQYGGGERHVTELCQTLARRGHQITLVVRPQSPLPALVAQEKGIDCQVLPLRGALDLASAHRLSKLLTDCDLVHAHYARDYPLTALAVRMCRRGARPAFFLTRHHYLPVRANWAYRRLLSPLDCAIAVSESVRATLANSFQLNASNAPFRLEVVPNWIDLNTFSLSDAEKGELRGRGRSRFGIKLGATALGIVNQLHAAKGQALLIEALARLPGLNRETVIVLAGREHDERAPYSNYLKDLAAGLGLGERVIFTGHVAELRELYAALDLVVIPSENEAFSIVCVEAMAARRPVIASAVGGLAELVKEGVTGLLFPAGDIERLAAQLERALGDEQLCAGLVTRAYQMVENSYARDRVITRIEELYREVLARRDR